MDSAAAVVSLAMPALQAAATILILEKQKDYYDDIASQRIALLNSAVSTFTASINAQIAGGAFDAAYGSVPEAILYKKLDTKSIGREVAEDSLGGLPAAKRYVEAANRIMEQDDIVRMMIFDGRFLCDMELASCTINQLLQGELPVDDVIEIVKDNAERAAMNGRIGNTHDMTLRDLGISQMRAKREGHDRMIKHGEFINRSVSDTRRMATIREFAQRPEQRLGIALTEAQLIQQSLQNQANAAAAGDPAEWGKLQAKLQEAINVLGVEAQRGNMINQFVPNYAAILAPAIDSISQALIGSGGPSEYTDAGYNTAPDNRSRTITEVNATK